MKVVVLILSFLLSVFVYGQDNRPALNFAQQAKTLSVKGYNTSKYKGYMYKLGVGILRLRTFSNDAIQLTYIIGDLKQIRFYIYYDVIETKYSYAISLRKFF